MEKGLTKEMKITIIRTVFAGNAILLAMNYKNCIQGVILLLIGLYAESNVKKDEFNTFNKVTLIVGMVGVVLNLILLVINTILSILAIVF